jgi:hypothetical protein
MSTIITPNDMNKVRERHLAKVGMHACIDTGDPIKALCWKQPFASLMLSPWNKVETRTQRVNYRGLVLIVATASPYSDRQLIELCGGEQALILQMKVSGPDGYMNGCAIGIGTLQDCTEIREGDKTFIKAEHHAWRYAWRFGDVFAIRPIQMKGFQGWRNVDDEVRSKIMLL